MHTLGFGLLFIKGFACLTITTPPEINATLESNSSIILNCTFEKKDNEQIRIVYWSKKISGDYKPLVDVTLTYADYRVQGVYLKNRSELLRFGNGSTSVVLIIKDVRCIDNGQYQCSITYRADEAYLTAENYTAVNIQANAQIPILFSVQPNISLEEHGMVKLSCVGNVGNPQRSLKIWKIYKTSNTKHLLKNESEVYADIENCTHIVNLTTTYNLTKEDNGALFRCSSQNQYTIEPVPATDIGPLEVFYGPSATSIIPVDNLSGLHVGDLVKFECVSDGNPNPNYTWMFNFTKVVSDAKYIFSSNKSELSFITTNITDSGYYQCVASNNFNGKTFNSSSNVTSLSVQEMRQENIEQAECNYDDISTLKTENINLRRELELLRSVVIRMDRRMSIMDNEITDLRSKFMRDNILIHNFKYTPNEDLVAIMPALIKQTLGVDVSFVRIHRNGVHHKKSGRPVSITAKLTDRNKKDEILNAQKIKKIARVYLPFYITPQQPLSLVSARNKLIDKSDSLKKQNISVKISRNSIVLPNGSKYREEIPLLSNAAVLKIDQAESELLDVIVTMSTEPIQKNGSEFYATGTKVGSVNQAQNFYKKVCIDPYVASVDSRILIYRFMELGKLIENYHDDGEHGAGRRLLKYMRENQIMNVAIVVTRWIGKHIGPQRFTIMEGLVNEVVNLILE